MITRSIFILTLFIPFMAGTSQAKVEKLTPTISWEVTADGTLMIEGTGEMPDFKYDKPQYWRHKRFEGKIKRIDIGEGINTIGAYNFYDSILEKGNSLSSVQTVRFPSTLTDIGLAAFSGTNIKELELPESVRVIHLGAFKNCRQLKRVTITSSELKIRSAAFENCQKLEEINFNDANVTLSRNAFCDDKALVSVKNSANAGFDAGLGFGDVFKNTSIRSLDDDTASSEPLSCPVPDGEWDMEYVDGGMIYAGTFVKLNFNGTMANDSSEKGIEAPNGYISSWDDQGEESFFKFSKPSVSDDKIIVKGTGYEGSNDNPKEKEFTITFDKARNSITIIDADYPDNPTEYLDYNRMRIPEDVFNTGYTGTISYEDRGEDVVGVSFQRDGDKVVMRTIVMHPFMAPPTEISFYSGKIEGREIIFNHKIEDLIYSLEDNDALNQQFPDWEEIESTGTSCERTITYQPTALYLDNILLEP